MRLGKTTLLHFGSQVVVSAAGFAVTFAIINQMGAAALGQYQILVGIGFFWLAIPANGIGEGVRKRMSEGEERGAFFGSGLVLNGLLALGLAAVVLGGSALLEATGLGSDSAFVDVVTTYDLELVALAVGAIAYRTALLALEGQKRVARTGALQAAERVTRGVVLLGLVGAGLGVSALVIGHTATLAVTAVVAFAVSVVSPVRPGIEHVKSVGRYARYAWMSALRGRVYGWMDTIILSMFLSSATLIGIYEAAWGIASLLGVVAMSVRRTLFPEVSELGVQDDYERVKHFLDEGLVFAGVFVIPGLFGAAVIGQRILQFYRADITQGGGVLVLLVLSYAIDVYASQFVSVVNGLDRPRAAFRVNLQFVAANVVLNLLLVPTVGWYGAAVATAVSAGVRAVLGFRTLSTVIGRPTVPVREIVLEVAAAGLMAAVIVPLEPVVPGGRVGTLLLVAVGAVVYVAVLLTVSTRVREKAISVLPVASLRGTT